MRRELLPERLISRVACERREDVRHLVVPAVAPHYDIPDVVVHGGKTGGFFPYVVYCPIVDGHDLFWIARQGSGYPARQLSILIIPVEIAAELCVERDLPCHDHPVYPLARIQRKVQKDE